MTVEELIKELEQQDPTKDVTFYHRSLDGTTILQSTIKNVDEGKFTDQYGEFQNCVLLTND